MVSFCQLVRSSRYGWGQQALITLEKLQTDETWKNKTKLLPKTATTKNMMTNSNKSNNKMVRLAWDSPQMLMDTWNKWVHHALASIDVWERKKKKHERSERALQPEEQGIRQSQPGLQWGSHPLLMPADICEPPTNYEPRVKCTVTCSAEPDSRGNVLSCRLRIWAHTQKCWKLADEDSQQIRKQATAALWTLSFSSYIPISHLLQHCQDSPSPALNLILSSSIFFVVVVAVVIFFSFSF